MGIISRVAFNPDGSSIVAVESVNESAARLFDVATGRPIGAPLKLEPVNGAWFSPDGKLVATTSPGGSIRFWDGATGLPIGPAMTGGGGLAFAPGGRSILTAQATACIAGRSPCRSRGAASA